MTFLTDVDVNCNLTGWGIEPRGGHSSSHCLPFPCLDTLTRFHVDVSIEPCAILKNKHSRSHLFWSRSCGFNGHFCRWINLTQTLIFYCICANCWIPLPRQSEHLWCRVVWVVVAKTGHTHTHTCAPSAGDWCVWFTCHFYYCFCSQMRWAAQTAHRDVASLLRWWE